jgi:hypothetical protein
MRRAENTVSSRYRRVAIWAAIFDAAFAPDAALTKTVT